MRHCVLFSVLLGEVVSAFRFCPFTARIPTLSAHMLAALHPPELGALEIGFQLLIIVL
jgi:hypothetical protein